MRKRPVPRSCSENLFLLGPEARSRYQSMYLIVPPLRTEQVVSRKSTYVYLPGKFCAVLLQPHEEGVAQPGRAHVLIRGSQSPEALLPCFFSRCSRPLGQRLALQNVQMGPYCLCTYLPTYLPTYQASTSRYLHYQDNQDYVTSLSHGGAALSISVSEHGRRLARSYGSLIMFRCHGHACSMHNSASTRAVSSPPPFSEPPRSQERGERDRRFPRWVVSSDT